MAGKSVSGSRVWFWPWGKAWSAAWLSGKYLDFTVVECWKDEEMIDNIWHEKETLGFLCTDFRQCNWEKNVRSYSSNTK